MHLSQLPSGSWRAIVQHAGKRRSVTAKTRGEAQRKAAALLVWMGAEVAVEALTVGELLDRHLAATPLQAHTRATYESARKHLPAAFEARAVASVSPPVVDALYRHLEATAVSPHSIRKVHSLLSGAFRRAVRLGLVALNPCREAELPPVPKPATRTPTTAEARLLLAACDEISPQFGLFARLAANTGARRGELLRLRRCDAEGHELVLRRTKTGNPGRVAITPELAERIHAHVVAQDAELLAVGVRLGRDAWLFTEDHHRPWYPSTPTHWWATARDACGIGDVRLNDLRHYVATELFAGGFDEQTTMRRLGHTNPVTTGKVYATSRPARDRAAAEYLSEQLEA